MVCCSPAVSWTPACGNPHNATAKTAGHSTIGNNFNSPGPPWSPSGTNGAQRKLDNDCPPGTPLGNPLGTPRARVARARVRARKPLTGLLRARPQARTRENRHQAPRRAPTALAAPAPKPTNTTGPKSPIATSATTKAENKTEWSAITSTDDSPPNKDPNKSATHFSKSKPGKLRRRPGDSLLQMSALRRNGS